MSPLPRKIFFIVTILLAVIFTSLNIQMLLADTGESCFPESVDKAREFLTRATGGSLLLWTGSFLLPRLREWLALCALLLLLLPMAALNSTICCHESYGNVPLWAALSLTGGFLSYSLLFVGRAFIPSLAGIILVIYLFFSTN